MKRFQNVRAADLFVSACFLGFLFAVMIVTVAREKESYSFFENRDLAAFPEYTAEADGNGSYMTQIEKYLADHAALRTSLVETVTRLDLAIGRPVINEVTLSEGHFLPYLGYPVLDMEKQAAQAEAMADSLGRIRDAVEDSGGHYLCAVVPNQHIYNGDKYPSYLDSNADQDRLNVQLLSDALAQRGMDLLDIGEKIDALGHPDNFMSRIDHHYTMQGAFLTYQFVMDKLSEISGRPLLTLRGEDVIFETLPNPYLGSRSRKLLGLVPSDEHIQLIRPKDEVPFTRTDSGVTCAASVYDLPESELDQVTYSIYMGGDNAQTTIETGRDELPSVLIYGDSFTNALECILYLSFDRMDSLDLRHYKEMSLTDYIRETRPDYVVYLRDYRSLLTMRDNGAAE